MAYKGFGIWALVIQSLFNNLVDTIILWVTVKWRPKLMFSWNRLKVLFNFGWKLLVSSLLDVIYTNLTQLVIGKLYTSEDLAYYNKGDHFPSLIVINLNSSINSVLLPTMSEEQNNIDRIRSMTSRALKISTYVLMPMMMGLAVCAEPIVTLLLTEKWLFCVPYLRIFCEYSIDGQHRKQSYLSGIQKRSEAQSSLRPCRGSALRDHRALRVFESRRF